MTDRDYGLFVVESVESVESVGSVGEFRRTRGQSPHVLETAPQAAP